MKSPKVVTAATAGAVALSLGLAACGGGDSGNTGGTGKFDAGSKAVVNASDKKGGTLKFAVTKDFDSTDPGNTYYAFSNNFLRNYTRTLMTWQSKPGADGVKPSPDLAEAPGTPNKDNTEWTYKLRKGLKYEDGTEIKAKDVKYAVARTYDRGILGKGPGYFKGLLKGDDYKGPYKDKNLDNYKGVTVKDDYTLVFHLKAPFAEFNELVSFSGQTAPVPADKDKGSRYNLHPLSSGPYKWEGDYQPGKGGTLVRNTNWDASTDPNRKALPEKITVEAGVNADEIDNRLMNGTLHVDLAGSGVQAAARQKILTDPKLKGNADNPLAGFHWYVPISTKNIPKAECRQAIVWAADRDAMYRAYGGDAGGQISTSIMPPGIEGREKGTDYYTKAEVGYKGDPAKAKEALAACGQPNGFETTIAFRSDRDKEKGTAEALAQSLAKVGIKAEIKGFPSDTYTGEQVGSPEWMKKNKVGIATFGWAPDWPTGYGYLQALLDGSAILPSGNNNISEYNDPEVNKLWKDVVKVQDPAERAKIYNQIDDKARKDAAVLPNVYAKSLLFRPTNVTNVYFHEGFGMYDYANLGVTG